MSKKYKKNKKYKAMNSQEINADKEMNQENTPLEETTQDEVTDNVANEKTVSTEDEMQILLKKKDEELEELKDRYLRLSAEFDNFRKRTMKEKAELILNGSEKCISSILPILDDFERALQNMGKATDVEAVKEGIDLIYNKFISTLEGDGVRVIETIGKELNTDLHDAIAVVPVPDEEQKQRIIDCVQKGYTLNDKVIRHAKVVVGE